jgi:hypothetical protein
MQKTRITICFLAVELLWLGTPDTIAVVKYNDGLIHNINYAVNDYFTIDKGTTVNLLTGGSFTWTASAASWVGNGHLNLQGGIIDGQLTIAGGFLNVSSGTLHYISIESGNVTMSGGQADSIYAYPMGRHAITNFSGGTIERIYVATGAYAIITGGTITDFLQSYGGADYAPVGKIDIYGHNFNYPLGAISNMNGVITGILQNGSPINCQFDRGADPYLGPGQIVLTPEPTTFILLVLGIPIISGPKRKQSIQR